MVHFFLSWHMRTDRISMSGQTRSISSGTAVNVLTMRRLVKYMESDGKEVPRMVRMLDGLSMI